MHDSPLSIDELSRRFNGQQRLQVDMAHGAGPSQGRKVNTLAEHEMIPNNNKSDEVEEPPETVARPPRPGRLAAIAAVEDDIVHTITPVARVFQAGRRRQRRIASPSPFVLQQQQQPKSAGGVASGGHVERNVCSVPLGPSKRKLHMSPFAALDDIGGSGGNMATRRRVTRRKVSINPISGRRRSTSGTPLIPRRRSFLAPSRSSEGPASQMFAVPLHTSIANSPP